MHSDEALWMKAALAALGRGRGLVDALDAADSTLTMFWRARERAIRPGLVKCHGEPGGLSAHPPSDEAECGALRHG